MKVIVAGLLSIPTEIEVNDEGRIDSDACWAFKRGHCHSLAVALHEQTKWPLIGVQLDSDRKDGFGPRHVMVYSPEFDDYIDIEGKGALVRMFMSFPDESLEVVPLTVEEIDNFKDYRPRDMKLGEPYASTVLTRLGVGMVQFKPEEANGSNCSSDPR